MQKNRVQTNQVPRWQRLADLSANAMDIATFGKLNGSAVVLAGKSNAFFRLALEEAGKEGALKLGNRLFLAAVGTKRTPRSEPYCEALMKNAIAAYDVVAEGCLPALGNRAHAKEFLEDFDGARQDLDRAILIASGQENGKGEAAKLQSRKSELEKKGAEWACWNAKKAEIESAWVD
jgi:hypothetical protein